MSSLPAMQLLSKAAHLSQEKKELFSKREILQKINEIKYLSAQKKVPKLTLRKEIIHLEHQLQGVIELEKKLLREKNKESVKMTALKQQITMLKNKLKTVEDQELDQKVERLSYLLGDYLAKKEVSKEVTFTKTAAVAAPLERKEKKKEEDSSALIQKAAMLQKRLEALKNELKIHQELETKRPEVLQMIEEKIMLLEGKLQSFYEKHPEALVYSVGTVEMPVPGEEIRHELLFPQSDGKKVEGTLPLPPPPRMERGKK